MKYNPDDSSQTSVKSWQKVSIPHPLPPQKKIPPPVCPSTALYYQNNEYCQTLLKSWHNPQG